MNSKLTYREAAIQILRERGPMHYRDMYSAIAESGLMQGGGTTPEASLSSMFAVDIKQNASKSVFIRVKPGVYGLRELHKEAAPPVLKLKPQAAEEDEASEPAKAADEDSIRVRIPHFPLYSELRHLLRIWPGFPRRRVTGLRAAINELRGTPQNTVDWSEPAKWIPARLRDEDRELALAIWEGSKGEVSPRYTYGHWLLAQRYELISEDPEGVLVLTENGLAFLEEPGGKVEAALDEAEGLVKLLSIVADHGPAPAAKLMEPWSDYLSRRSSFKSDSTRRETLRNRLNNLLERKLVERKGTLYSATPEGLSYLEGVGDEDSLDGGDNHELWALIRKQEQSVRESLRELLLDMDPILFEHLVKRLLEEMNYQNVEVTLPSGDGGVDVVADIELGITSVREVVQVKRHRRAIQRKDLDALRGSLYRFDAVRGTIVTTSLFAKGAREAAFATGAAPITLIDGDKLIDLLIEHGIGVRKRKVDLLELEPSHFQDGGEQD